jgi:predicted permease
MRIPLVAGREFTAQDTDQAPQVAIVNQELAGLNWPGQNAIGKRVFTRGRWFTVVGVSRNGRYHRLAESVQEPLLYLPLFQSYRQDAIIHVRVAGNPEGYASVIMNSVHELDPNLPVFNVTTFQKNVQIASIFVRIAGTFVGAFGLIALVLATVGIYAVVAYTTRQRTHEIGIRMALGAQQSDVMRLVLAQGLRLMLAGLAIGFFVSHVLTRFLENMLIGVTTTDTLTYASVAALLSVVALTACFVPAWRATKVDPTVALHHE